jgi:three-Cys-motif partner protein
MKRRKSTDNYFFKGKRSWSIIKDRVLARYMPPYLSKVSRLGFPILLIDCFAGKGKFDDNTPGSPLIMCQMVEKHANGKGRCIFVNKNNSHHKALLKLLDTFVQKKIAFPIHADSQSLLREAGSKKKFTVFAYLDPFGLKGCEFDVIESLLRRAGSTEILVNLNMPVLHRLAACKAVSDGRASAAQIQRFHRVLDEVLGGDYWKKYMFNSRLSREDKEKMVVKEYMEKLKAFLPYVGSCPVRERDGAVTKYFIIFCSRHPDGITLMNEMMCVAYNDYMHEVSLKEFNEEYPLLRGTLPGWQSGRDRQKNELKCLIIEILKTRAGLTRQGLWRCIVEARFMAFLEKEYRAATQELADVGEIHSTTIRRTRRLNDDCILKLGPGERLASNG